MVIRIGYLEVHSDNPSETLAFYEKLFGVQAHRGENGSGGFGLGDSYFAVTKTPESGEPPEFGADVDDLGPYIGKMKKLGIEFEEPTEIESDGRKYLQTSFKDADGRLVSLFQPLMPAAGEGA
jgi:predicted enzyme related to lactoylglutathione lyase